ncbi:hypothetical protein KY329_03750 [Candidatus Woesearchaeota archaeon]|nr:hypothetical protein [Candidatus Woesearchaeota archaeon]
MAEKSNTMKELIEKYKQKLKEQLDIKATKGSGELFSREYKTFREEVLPAEMGIFEKACNFAGKILKIKAKPEKAAKMQSAIESCHLQVTPSGVMALSILLPIVVMLLGLFASIVLFGSLFFAFVFILVGLVGIVIIQKTPEYLANLWRMKSSNQMVICIFYIVTYMRHTSNLELAIEFASQHLAPPLSLDLRKIIWDVESGKFESVKESLESYLKQWQETNKEFVESFHLVESSLYEGSEDRRVAMLDKALDVILDQTYEKMLHYAQNLKGPITMLHMLGIVLPILGLVVLPLVVSFMEGVQWYHIATLYNIILPIAVYFLARNILSKRPTGYGETDISETNPEIKKYKNVIIKIGKSELRINPAIIAVIIGSVFLFIGLLPQIIHFINPSYDLTIAGFDLLGYRESKYVADQMIGPYGLGASLLSLFIPLALAFSIGLWYRLRSANVIKIREESKKLEEEFSSALFQLGNRLGDGLPAEIAFQKVAEVVGDTTAGKFFKLAAANITKLGMGIKEALFNPKIGALTQYPSAIIQSSMKVLIESIRKGPRIAAQALLNVSRYIKEIHKVNERLKDLMAETISDMKSQIKFLTPIISGIVIGITSMITCILGKLSGNIEALGGQNLGAQITTLSNLFGDGVPTYYFQAVVGVYVFQIIFILTVISNGVENGHDKLQEKFLLGKNLINSTTLYCFIAGLIMLIFNLIALQIISSTTMMA